MKFKLHNAPAILGGLIIITAFFLPYIDFMFIKLTGFELVKLLANKEQAGMMKMNEEYMIISLIIWSMFPLAGILAFLGGIFNKKYITLTGLIMLLLVMTLMLAGLAYKGEKPMFFSYNDMIGSGLYLSVLGAMFLFGFVIAYRKEEQEGAGMHKPMFYISSAFLTLFVISLVWFNMTVA